MNLSAQASFLGKFWWREVLTVGLVFVLSIGCARHEQKLVNGVVAAAKNVPTYSSQWEPAIREVARRYVASLKTNRPDAEGSRLAHAAIAQGCEDPFVRYVAFRRRFEFAEVANEKDAQEGWKIVQEMAVFGYPSVVQAYATMRAQMVWTMAFGYGREQAMTKQLSDLTWQNTLVALNDKTVPEWMSRSLADALEITWSGSKSGREFVAAQVDAVLSKRYGDCATLHLLRGVRLTRVAWDARGHGLPHTVTAEGQQEFERVLLQAKPELERAWALDPHDGNTAAAMIIVCIGLHRPAEEMEMWFRRGVETGQDADDLASNKNYYLGSYWHGSLEQQLAFSRECLAHPEWSERSLLQLWRTHAEHQSIGDLPLAYFARPEVWNDIKLSLSKYLERNPDATNRRFRYAYHAWLAQDWPVLREQLPQLDLGAVNLERYGGVTVHQKMLSDAKAHADSPYDPAAATSARL